MPSAPQDVDERATPDRLLDVTEVVVAEVGVFAASVRRINAESGANVAAVHYHFGSKHGLIEAALARRMGVLADERAAAIARLPDPPTLRDVVRVVVEPLADFVDRMGHRAYVRFLWQLEQAGGEWRALARAAYGPQAELIEPLYDGVLGHLTPGTRAARRVVASHVLLEMLAHPDEFVGGEPDPATISESVIDVLVGLWSAPETRVSR
jgi:AcrR family transcriptional regulator